MKKLQLLCLTAILLVVAIANAQIKKTITGFNHVESIVADGKYLYAADIGAALNPTAKDSDEIGRAHV